MSYRATAVCSLALACLAPGVAFAEPPADAVRAETLFRSAKQIRDAGWYADACPLFKESDGIAHGVGVSLYLADCDEHLGRTASAWNGFRAAEKLARERADGRAELAHARAEALARRLSGLTILVPPSAKDWDLALDGAALSRDSWNVALVVDPGDHTVTVTSQGHPARVLTARVSDGDRNATLVVPEVEPVCPAAVTSAPSLASAVTSAPAAAPAAPASPPDTPKVETDPRRWLGIGLLAAGAGGIVAGMALFLGHNQGSGPNAPAESENESADTGAAVALIAGGALIAAGISLTIATPAKAKVGLVAAPVLIAGGGGAVLQGGF